MEEEVSDFEPEEGWKPSEHVFVAQSKEGYETWEGCDGYDGQDEYALVSDRIRDEEDCFEDEGWGEEWMEDDGEAGFAEEVEENLEESDEDDDDSELGNDSEASEEDM